MRHVTGAAAATRLFEAERAELRMRRRAKQLARAQSSPAESATRAALRVNAVEALSSPRGLTSHVPDSGSE
jgi:hypothetical protein